MSGKTGIMTQKDKVLKAKVAVALYREFGRVPSQQEIDTTYHQARVLYRTVLGTHFLRRKQKDASQMILF